MLLSEVGKEGHAEQSHHPIPVFPTVYLALTHHAWELNLSYGRARAGNLPLEAPMKCADAVLGGRRSEGRTEA